MIMHDFFMFLYYNVLRGFHEGFHEDFREHFSIELGPSFTV